MKPASASPSGGSGKTGFTHATIDLFERVIPDPFVLAILITAFVAVVSALFAPHPSFMGIVGGWYKGFFDILTFAFQITLILVTGHAFAHALLYSGFFARSFLSRVRRFRQPRSRSCR